MAELVTLARPYAKAAFEVAMADSGLENWSNMLAVVAAVTENDAVASMLSSPALAAVAEHPAIVERVEALLEQPAHLTAFVACVRTPGTRVAARTTTTSAGARWALR